MRPAAYSRQRALVGSVQAGVEKRKFLISIGDRNPNPPALSESLYQLRYPGPYNCTEHTHTQIHSVDKTQVFSVKHGAILTTILERASTALSLLTCWEIMKVWRTLRYGKLI